MGILNFTKWIKENYIEAYMLLSTKPIILCDNLYIDLNYLLHKILYQCSDIKQLTEKCSESITYLCKKIVPIKNLYLCADGCAPLAKLLTQKSRRINITDKSEISLNLTPGCIFMDDLENNLKYCIDIIKLVFNINVIVDIKNPGEAEIKIKHYMLSNCNDSNHVLYTNDADIILISSCSTFYNNIYIFHYDNIDSNTKKEYLLSIGKILELHFNKILNINIHNIVNHRFNLDFTLLNMLYGNDYLTKIKLVNILNNDLWKAYASCYDNREYLINSNLTINFNKLVDILLVLVGSFTKNNIAKLDLTSYNEYAYNNWIYGLNWCFNMYYIGDCIKYDYIYDFFGLSINPILLNSHLYKITIDLTINKVLPISNHLCGILLIPYSHKNLINNTYHHFIELYYKIIYTQLNSNNISTLIRNFTIYETSIHNTNSIELSC